MADLLTTAQAAELCGVNPQTMRRWLIRPSGPRWDWGRRRGRVPATRMVWRIALRFWLSRHRCLWHSNKQLSVEAIGQIEALTQGARHE